MRASLTYSNDRFRFENPKRLHLTSKRVRVLANSPNAVLPDEWPSHVTLAPVMGAGELKGIQLAPSEQRSYGSLELSIGRAFGRNTERNSVTRLEIGYDQFGGEHAGSHVLYQYEG